eukprot:3107851-Ditylum_brightwellii.AAC.1
MTSTPGLSKVETIRFFTNTVLMEVAKKTFTKLGKEEVIKAEDLAEFNQAMWKQVVDNLQCPGGQMKNPDKNADKDSTVPQTIYVFGVKM